MPDLNSQINFFELVQVILPSSERLRVFARNLSADGIFLYCNEPPPQGTKVALEFSTPEGPVHVDEGEVVWSQALAPGGPSGSVPGMSVRFCRMSAESRQSVDRYLVIVREESNLPQDRPPPAGGASAASTKKRSTSKGKTVDAPVPLPEDLDAFASGEPLSRARPDAFSADASVRDLLSHLNAETEPSIAYGREKAESSAQIGLPNGDFEEVTADSPMNKVTLEQLVDREAKGSVRRERLPPPPIHMTSEAEAQTRPSSKVGEKPHPRASAPGVEAGSPADNEMFPMGPLDSGVSPGDLSQAATLQFSDQPPYQDGTRVGTEDDWMEAAVAYPGRRRFPWVLFGILGLLLAAAIAGTSRNVFGSRTVLEDLLGTFFGSAKTETSAEVAARPDCVDCQPGTPPNRAGESRGAAVEPGQANHGEPTPPAAAAEATKPAAAEATKPAAAEATKPAAAEAAKPKVQEVPKPTQEPGGSVPDAEGQPVTVSRPIFKKSEAGWSLRLRTSAPTKIKSFTLDNPPRLAIDFESAAPAGRLGTVDAPSFVKQVRMAAHEGFTRFVFEFSTDVMPEHEIQRFASEVIVSFSE